MLYKPKLNSSFSVGHIIGGEISLEGTGGQCLFMEDTKLTVNDGQIDGCNISNSTILAEGSATLWASTVNASHIEGVTLNSVTVKDSYLVNINTGLHHNNFIGNVIDSLKGSDCSNYFGRANFQRNIWLNHSLEDLRSCGFKNLERLVPFLTSEDPLHDIDGDGIPDIRDHDNDNDGYSDFQELKLANQFDPFDPESKPDPSVFFDNDMDGITDSEDTDIDNDGLSNDEELNIGSSPYMLDTDLDGVSDYYEHINNYDASDKLNQPLTGQQANINLSIARYKNTNGEIIMIGQEINRNSYFKAESNMYCWGCEIDAGTEVISLSSSYFTYLTTQFEVGNPIRFNLTKSSVNFDYSQLINIQILEGANHLSGLFGSTLQYCEGRFSVSHSFVENSIINLAAADSSLIERTKIDNGPNPGRSSIHAAQFSYSSLKNVDAWIYDINSQLAPTFRHSVIDGISMRAATIYDSYLADVKGSFRASRSDVIISDSNQYQPWASFFNQSYLKIDQSVLDYEGDPIDRLGDGVIDTEIKIIDWNHNVKSILVDGIASPKVTPYFSNGADSVVILNHVGNQ